MEGIGGKSSVWIGETIDQYTGEISNHGNAKYGHQKASRR